MMGEKPTENLLRDTEARRLELLRAIGAKRNSVVIAYLTSTRAGVNLGAPHTSIDDRDIEVIERHVREAKRAGARNIDLFLTTYGGDGTAPWSLVAMMREYLRDGAFRVIIPTDAYSAGSAISLGADEIVMGPASVLGPVDSQLPWLSDTKWRWASASDFDGLLELAGQQSLGDGRARGRLLDWLTTRMDAIAAGAFYRKWKEDRRHVLNLLESRRPPLSRAQNERLMRFMLYEVGEHGQAIRRSEARANGLSFITDLERTGLEDSVVALFGLYAGLLKLHTPFARPSKSLEALRRVGDEADFDASGAHISETPIAIVESEFDTNPAYVAYGLRHWGATPPIKPADLPKDAQAPAVPARPAATPAMVWTTTRDGASADPSTVTAGRVRKNL